MSHDNLEPLIRNDDGSQYEGKGKGKAKACGDKRPEKNGKRQLRTRASKNPQFTTPFDKDASAALARGDAQVVATFLRRLLPTGATRGGAAHQCLKRALALTDQRWKVEIDEKRMRTFASEEPGHVDAVKCGEAFLPADALGSIMAYVSHRDAVLSTPVSRAWWRTVSSLPQAEHIDMTLHSSRAMYMGWSSLINQIKIIRSSNPRRNIRRLTLGHRVKLGNLRNLSSAAGGLLTHVDFTQTKGTKQIDFDELVKQMPCLRGMALKETFNSCQSAPLWLRHVVHAISALPSGGLESLHVEANNDEIWPGYKPKWNNHHTGMVDDRAIKALVEAGGNTLRHLSIAAPRSSPELGVTGMGALGCSTPALEELFLDHVRVSLEGWKAFVEARSQSGRPLHRIAIRFPSEALMNPQVCNLLADAVTEVVEVHLPTISNKTGGGERVRDGVGAGSSSAPRPDSSVVVLGGDKVRVCRVGYRRWHCSASDL